MSRSHRLFDLMQVFRRYRGTVSGESLARELGVSVRTIRRDVAMLQGIGADIDGEAGVGYIFRPGFLLPPLSFTEEEIQALVVGAQWVSRQTDHSLALAVQNALAKIDGILPPEMRRALDDNMIYVGADGADVSLLDLAEVRRALRDQRKMRVTYADQHGATAEAIVWPIMLGFVESKRFIAAWCEHDEAFRVFQVDQILKCEFLDDYYRRNRRQLVKEWRAVEARPCNRQNASH